MAKKDATPLLFCFFFWLADIASALNATDPSAILLYMISSAFNRTTFALVIFTLMLPFAASAQQLRIVDEATTAIDPTAYRAYYGKLAGEPHVYTFSVENDTPVTFVLLVPDVVDVNTGVSVTLVDANDGNGLFVTGDGALVEWQRFFDTAGRDSYLAGPMIQETLPPGDYRIQVSSAADDAPYVLVVGGEETFSIAETIRRYVTVPAIKSDFFGKSSAEAYLTPLLLWPILGFSILLALVVFAVIIYLRRRPAAMRNMIE